MLVKVLEKTLSLYNFRVILEGTLSKNPTVLTVGVSARSSTYPNFGIIQTNSKGVIDFSFCGNDDIWKFPALAMRDTKINFNDRICQFRIVKNQPEIRFKEVDDLQNESRGGIGATGIK